MVNQRVSGWLALIAWIVTISSSAFYEYREYDVPNWGLGYLILSSSFAAIGLSIATWAFGAGTHEGRVAKSILILPIVSIAAMIPIALVVG
jgi:hypothetical protein